MGLRALLKLPRKLHHLLMREALARPYCAVTRDGVRSPLLPRFELPSAGELVEDVYQGGCWVGVAAWAPNPSARAAASVSST